MSGDVWPELTRQVDIPGRLIAVIAGVMLFRLTIETFGLARRAWARGATS